LEALHSGAAAMPDVQQLEELLESILSETTETLKFEFAAISLVDEYRNCIETVRGRNISLGWIMRAKHQLTVPDIQTHIVKSGETKVVVGWDNMLDKDIYDRFEHWRLARVWAPILGADRRVVGTIEAGCNKERADEVLTEGAIERVRQLGREKGDQIARMRPHILMQGFARDAIRLIGADSATLHVYRKNTVELPQAGGLEWGELILAAGAGEATPEFVQADTPRREGRGRQAIQNDKPAWLDDPRQFKAEYPHLYEMGVRALAVIPLKLGMDAEGTLGIHFWWSEKRFTSVQLDLARMFAREMGGVIQNYLLLRRVTEAGGRAWALSGLQSLMQSLTSPFSLPEVLKEIAKNALLTLDADNVTVYQYHADKNYFYSPPIVDGHFDTPAPKKLKSDSVLLELVRHGVSQFIVDAHNHSALATPNESGNPRFIDREGVKSCAVVVLRSKGEVVGLLFANFRQVHAFSVEEKRVVEALATSAALAIRNARMHKDDLNRQLETTREVHAAIAEKGPDLTQVLERLLQQTLKHTHAQYGLCMRWNEHTQLLEPIARWPVREGYPIAPQSMEEGIVGLAAKSRKSILVEDLDDESASVFVETVGDFLPAKIYKKVNSDARCEIAVPLLDEGRLLGVLNIEHSESGFLTHDHRVFLQTLAVPAIIGFHTVELYKRLERRIRHLTALNSIAARVPGNPYKLDTILRLYLTGITAGAGLAFSRAMLFLGDPEGGVLRGQLAIGSVSQQTAQTLWDKFEQGGSSSSLDLESFLQAAEEVSDENQEADIRESSPLERAIRQVSFPVDHLAGAAAECLLQGKTVTVAFGQDDAFRNVLAPLTQPHDVPHAFAAVPLVGKSMGPIGVLVVDNRFLWKEREVEAEDIVALEAFARLMSLSIENVRLQDSVAEEKRIENWKEVTGFVAHSVGNFLFEVKGDAGKLRGHIKNLPDGEKLAALVDELNRGISGAQRVLLDFRNFANPTPLELEQLDLRQILTDVFDPVRGCPVEMSLPFPLPVLADPTKLGHALREIRKNALEAMSAITDRPNLIRISLCVDEDLMKKRYVQLQITDNGPGISDSVIRDIFKPGVTTKADGTGLGLPMVKSVIEGHGGTIEAGNSPDGGAFYTVRIPMIVMPEECDPRSGE